MAKGFYDDNEERLLTDGTDTKYEEDPRTEKDPESEEYYELPLAIKSRNRIWSIISLALGVLSIILCPFYYASLGLAVVSLLASLISRRNLGFFDKCSVMGLILGIVGFVCGVFMLIASVIGVFAI